jgi:Spy/CpxP family protein refolding chaperone
VTRARLALVLALTGAASLAHAQAPGGPATASEGPPVRRGREEALKMVDAYIISNLQESIDLTDAQFLKLLPLVKKLQTDRQVLSTRRIERTQELRRLLRSGTATEARVADLLRDLKAAEVEEPATLRKDFEAIDAGLSPMQQAKFRVLEAEVEFKIRELMGRVRAGGNRNPGRARPDAQQRRDLQ